MNIQNDNSFWATMWLIILTAVCVIVAVVCAWDCVLTHLYTSRDYTRATLPGAAYAEWVKVAK